MVISWYLVFFTPKDLFTQFLLKTRVTFIFSMAQDFQRLHLCLAGVNAVAKIHPQAFFYMIFIGGKIFFFIRKRKTIAYCLSLITLLNVWFQFCFFIVSERLPGFVCTNIFSRLLQFPQYHTTSPCVREMDLLNYYADMLYFIFICKIFTMIFFLNLQRKNIISSFKAFVNQVVLWY